MGIAEVSFFAGTLLFFVAIIGGGIEIKELKIPQVTGSAKYSCLAGGVLFIVLGLYLKNVFSPLTASTQATTVKAETTVISTTPVLPIQPNAQTKEPVTSAQSTQAEPTPSTEATNTAEKSLLAKHNAEAQLDAMTKRLNEVWNAADQDILNELLPKQQNWLKQRDTECATKAANEPNTDEVMKEALKIGCMAKLTEPRIEQLQKEIKELEQSIVEEPQTSSIASVNSISIQDNTAKQQAKQQLDEANKRLNAVWNATTAEIRKELLPEQREWLKKREEDCTAQAVNEDKAMQEVLKLSCMVNMTDPRTEELKQKVADLTQ